MYPDAPIDADGADQRRRSNRSGLAAI